jgi:hypothetical protein
LSHSWRGNKPDRATSREHGQRWTRRRTWSAGLTDREASHIGFFDLVFTGRTEAAIAALYAHLAVWQCDALVVASAANPNGLIGASGRIGQKHQIAMLMDSLAPHYGDDFWFLSYHAMALSEDGQLAAARMKIEKSVAAIQARQQTERRFAVRVRIAVPPKGLGRQIEIMYAWLDETCGAEGWGTAPAGLVGVLNDAIAFYFDDAAFAHAFVARFCCGCRVEAVEGAFALRNDTPPPRRGASVHKTP